MKLEDIKAGSRVWINLTSENGVGELKAVSPDCLEKIKREKKKEQKAARP